MSPALPYISLLNQDLILKYRQTYSSSPVTIQHSPYRCPACNDACWIGPRQKLLADLGQGRPRCIKCLSGLGVFDDKSKLDIVCANPAIENVPRRLV